MVRVRPLVLSFDVGKGGIVPESPVVYRFARDRDGFKQHLKPRLQSLGYEGALIVPTFKWRLKQCIKSMRDDLYVSAVH